MRARLMLVLWLAASAASAAAPYAGRPLQDVLRELSRDGINFIYNTELVPATLTVTAEPSARTPVAWM